MVLAVTGRVGGGAPGYPPKDEGEFRKWLKKQLSRLANALKRLGGKTVAALPGIIGSVVGAILQKFPSQMFGWVLNTVHL